MDGWYNGDDPGDKDDRSSKRRFPVTQQFKISTALDYHELPKYLTKEEVVGLLSSIKSVRDHLMVNLLWRTGTRISEMLGIRVKDIDFYSKSIVIKTLKQKPRKGRIPSRVIPLQRDIIGELDRYIAMNSLKEEDRIVTITRQDAHYLISRYCRKFGIDSKRSHPHVFRHSFAINCVLQGVPMLVLKAWLGHRSVEALLVYTQVLAKDTRPFMDGLEF